MLRCLLVLMTIIAQSRMYGILYTSFCLPMQWPAAKTPELREWGWGPISNGDAIDTLRKKMIDIVNDTTKVLDKGFMMNMFSKYIDALPPFQQYWEHLFEKNQLRVIVAESSATVLQFAKLRKELFHPSDVTNAATDECLGMSCTMRQRQCESICLYWDLLYPIRDVQRMLRRI